MRLLDIVFSHRAEAAKYHDHKEKTAYATTALYLTGAAAWALNGEFWENRSWPRDGGFLILCAVFLLIAAVLVWLFVSWQLRNREDAARLEAACVNVLARIAAGQLKPDEDVEFDYWQESLLMPKPIVAEGKCIRAAVHCEVACHVWLTRIALVLVTVAVLARIIVAACGL